MIKGLHRWQEISVAAGLVVLALWLRWPTFGFSLWNLDEAIHSAAARTLLDGGVLYRDAIDQRTPLSYYAVAGIFAFFGENNLWAVRCFVALLVAATGWMLFLAGRSLRGVSAGIATGLLYVLLSTAVLFQGDANAANTEWFAAFFSSAGAAVFLGRGADGNKRRIFATGLLFSAAFLSKQPALLDAAAPLFALVYASWRKKSPLLDSTKRILTLAAGWMTPVLLTAGYLAAQGALGDAIFYTWTYNLTYYGPEIATTDRAAAALLPFQLLGTSQPWLLAVWGAGALLVMHRLLQRQPSTQEEAANPRLVFVTVWSVAALAGTAAGGRDFQHYMIQFLAPFCLGAGLVLTASGGRAWTGTQRALLRPAAMLLFGVIAYHALSGAIAARQRTLPEDASLRISIYIREHSAPTDKVFVWGYHPDIYLLADRLPASRFLYASFLTGLVPWTNGAPERDTAYAIVPGAMETLLNDLGASRPKFIVDCSAGPNRFWPKYPLDKFPALHAFISKNYRQTESHQFLPQGFRLFERRSPGDVPDENPVAPLPAEIAAKLTLGTLGSPLSPAFASARHGTNVSMVDARLEYFAHAPATFTYRIPAGASALRGGFGFKEGAFSTDNPTPTDGAEFIIRWRPVGGPEQVLLRRLLRPREEAADRGIQSFRVTLPAHVGGELELAITPGPSDIATCDWTYWSDLLLENYR